MPFLIFAVKLKLNIYIYMGHQDQHGKNLCFVSLFFFYGSVLCEHTNHAIKLQSSFLVKLGFGVDSIN